MQGALDGLVLRIMDIAMFLVSHELGYIFCRHLNCAVHRRFPGRKAAVDCNQRLEQKV